MATANRNIKLKDIGFGKEAKRRFVWVLGDDAPKSVDDLAFVGRDTEGRMNWWSVTPPKTNYWHAHQVLGRAYAFQLLDLMNNPEAECPEHIVSYIVDSMAHWKRSVPGCVGEAMPHGFFEVLSEYLTTGNVNR